MNDSTRRGSKRFMMRSMVLMLKFMDFTCSLLLNLLYYRPHPPCPPSPAGRRGDPIMINFSYKALSPWERARRRRGEVTNAGSVSLGLCADVLYAFWINQVAVLYANCVDFWAGYEVVYAKDCVFWWFYMVYAKFVYTMRIKV